MPGRTFRLNEAVCGPYGADFDGDEMNVHVPQTQEARAEAKLLMGVRYNMVTPKTGEPLVAAIQDFITASYLLSHKDRFLDKSQISQIVACIDDAMVDIDLPPPAIIKPVRLWTGKQVFGVLLVPNKSQARISINLEVRNKNYKRDNHMDPEDGFVVFK